MTPYSKAKEAYKRDGFVTGIDVFSSEKIEKYRVCFDELEKREGRERCQISIQGWHFQKRFIWEMATDPRLLDLMETIMGGDILLLSTHFFCKYPDPGGEKFVAWHQDVTYWGLEPPVAHTAWIAIDDSDIENGCMKGIPGSHRAGIFSHGKSKKRGNLLSINQQIPEERLDTHRAENLELKAGQVSIHQGCLVHASAPNLSNRRRCGLTVRYISPHVRQTTVNSYNQTWQPILVRGVDRYRHFSETPPPFSPRK